MFPELPSLRDFRPKFYTGGVSRFYLALVYDLIRLHRPQTVVIAGFSDGQLHFTCCQAATEVAAGTVVTIVRRDRVGESPDDDDAWQATVSETVEFYQETAVTAEGVPAAIAARFADGTVDLLLIDDCDSGAQVSDELHVWQAKLSANAVVLIHGIQLNRPDPPRRAWDEFRRLAVNAVEFTDGIGLGVAALGAAAFDNTFAAQLFGSSEAQIELRRAYELINLRVDAAARAEKAERENAALQLRQVWLDTLLDDRWKAQDVMDHQARELQRLRALVADPTLDLVDLQERFRALQTDRDIAQRVMDEQMEELTGLRARFSQLESSRSAAQAVMDEQLRELTNLRSRFEELERSRSAAQGVMDEQAQEIESLRHRFAELARDRAEAQAVMDRQATQIEEQQRSSRAQQRSFDELHRDRIKAQLIMDTQVEQLKQWGAKTEQLTTEFAALKKQLSDHKQILKTAKNNCRKNGRCFRIATDPKPKRTIPEKILRELRRIPANLTGARRQQTAAKPPGKSIPSPEPPSPDRYPQWIAEHEPTAAAIEQQRRAAAAMAGPKISLLIPTYNTPVQFLDELFVSLTEQTYRNFEFCVVDGGSDNVDTIARLKTWAQKEQRLRVEFLPQNLGIAENTNRALATATGEFVALVDHDDLLAPFALYEVARAIVAQPTTDIVYSDEDRWSEAGQRHSPFFKPEWSPELLYSCMYLGHLTVYRRSLLEKIGGFRKEFDLSQDYDLALRATEQARQIRHLPHVLYHWREHASSGSTGGKPDARKTNLAALADAMRRRGLPADVLEYPTANRVRMKSATPRAVSIIIPTDSAQRARELLTAIPRLTDHPKLEVIVVTNSRLANSLKALVLNKPQLRLLPYDKPFNFSDKCNAGADAASGDRLIFYNDDVMPRDANWVQETIEPLENPDVGAVSPKLLYETGKIQHAGLVTGVRGLIGTAFHQQPADSTIHVNFAQSMRNVSALSGACLAVRKDDFLRVGGFDAVNTPVSHSDIDLCFKLREAGLRCVYTPFATLLHTGHVSLVDEEKKPEVAAQRDKSSIYLLKRWGGAVTHDPYYSDNMRDWLYADSPTPIRMFGRDNSAPETGLDLLFISHDLSLSGAPILLLHLARWCKEHGFFVTAMAPEDGPLRVQYEAAGIPLILDPLISTEHESFSSFLRNFDAVLANTIRGWPAIRAAKQEGVPALWWLHETEVGEHFLREDAQLRMSIPHADVIFAPSERTASVYRPFTDNAPRRIAYGIPDLGLPAAQPRPHTEPLRFLLLGSVEPRKGQDVFAEALRSLPLDVQQKAVFQIAGRVMDPQFEARVHALAKGVANLTISGALDHAEALTLLGATDVLVCASRDEAMPVTILEAMCLGKTILSTRVGGVPEYIESGENGVLVKPEEPADLAAAIERLILHRDEVRRLGKNARMTFEREFGMDRFGREFIALVHEMIAANRSADTFDARQRTPVST
ncbi:MAG: glycosyltransferase, partial [Verrucomicrobiota bacterium]|nr:glycosyltransferase [Verrucomicrobiota bacterium]